MSSVAAAGDSDEYDGMDDPQWSAPTLNPTPHTLHHAPYTMHPTPYTLRPTPYTLHPAPYTLRPTHPAAGGDSDEYDDMDDPQWCDPAPGPTP